MKLVEELFFKYTVVEEKLVPYGFVKNNEIYSYNQQIHNKDFELRVKIENGNIDAKLFDTEFNDEYALINVDTSGGYIASLKEECSAVLTDIRDKCFKLEYFAFAQTNRIAELFKEKYGSIPEEIKFGGSYMKIFRNNESRKWIAIVMYTKKNKITGTSEEKVEILALNFKNEALDHNEPGLYHPYKNKNKNWVSIIMDDSLTDEEIMKYVEISYKYSLT
jgi:predicted DNA-binding protein (MmcQ/YjbR family)